MIKNSFAIIVLFISQMSFAQDNIPKSVWVSTPVIIDGKALEWKLPLRFYDDGTKLFFAFANDDKNLYVCFQSPDDMFQEKIIHAGMEVSFSVKGKNKVSVTFPLVQQSITDINNNNNSDQQSIDRKNRKAAFILQNTLMDVKGFATRNGMIPINDTSGIHAAINWDENNKLTYEIAIPFKEWFGEGYAFSDAAKDISMDVILNALKQPHHVSVGNENAGRGRAGNGGLHHPRNADTDEENHVMPGEYKYSLYEKRKLKQKFILAQSNDISPVK